MRGTDGKSDVQEVKNDNYYEVLSDNELTSNDDEDDKDEESELDIGVQGENETEETSDDDESKTHCKDMKHCKAESQHRKEIIETIEDEKKKLMEEVVMYKQKVEKAEKLKAENMERKVKSATEREKEHVTIVERLLLSNNTMSVMCYLRDLENRNLCDSHDNNSSDVVNEMGKQRDEDLEKEMDMDRMIQNSGTKKDDLKTIIESHIMYLEDIIDEPTCEFYDRVEWSAKVERGYAYYLLEEIMMATDGKDIDLLLNEFEETRKCFVRFMILVEKHDSIRD